MRNSKGLLIGSLAVSSPKLLSLVHLCLTPSCLLCASLSWLYLERQNMQYCQDHIYSHKTWLWNHLQSSILSHPRSYFQYFFSHCLESLKELREVPRGAETRGVEQKAQRPVHSYFSLSLTVKNSLWSILAMTGPTLKTLCQNAAQKV